MACHTLTVLGWKRVSAILLSMSLLVWSLYSWSRDKVFHEKTESSSKSSPLLHWGECSEPHTGESKLEVAQENCTCVMG